LTIAVSAKKESTSSSRKIFSFVIETIDTWTMREVKMKQIKNRQRDRKEKGKYQMRFAMASKSAEVA